MYVCILWWEYGPSWPPNSKDMQKSWISYGFLQLLLQFTTLHWAISRSWSYRWPPYEPPKGQQSGALGATWGFKMDLTWFKQQKGGCSLLKKWMVTEQYLEFIRKNYLITPAYLGTPSNDRASWMTWFCCSISFSDICRMVSIVVNLGRKLRRALRPPWACG